VKIDVMTIALGWL